MWVRATSQHQVSITLQGKGTVLGGPHKKMLQQVLCRPRTDRTLSIVIVSRKSHCPSIPWVLCYTGTSMALSVTVSGEGLPCCSLSGSGVQDGLVPWVRKKTGVPKEGCLPSHLTGSWGDGPAAPPQNPAPSSLPVEELATRV